MRIAKNELLAGIPVLKIRDYFRLLYSGLMTRDGLAERFNLNEKETEGLVGELLCRRKYWSVKSVSVISKNGL